MSAPSLGFFFFPQSGGKALSNAEIFQRCLDKLGGIERVSEVFVAGEDTDGLSREHACELLLQSQRGGSVTIEIAGFSTDLWFMPTASSPEKDYRYLRIEVPAWKFAEIEGDPMRVEVFASTWVSLCETLHAQAAYFDRDNAGKIATIALRCINKLRQGAFEEFARTRYWRAYLDPSATRSWYGQNQQVESPWRENREQLPSGALVLSPNDRYNPKLGDGDALLNARFLLSQVEKRAEIAGASALLTILRQEEKRLQRIESDADYLKHGEEAYYDWEGLRESRALLDEVRATWACALERPGLVGVQQTFTDASGRTEMVVPVVAAEGREWLLATLLYPYELTSTEWMSPEGGLQARVQDLLNAARQHPTDGEPPRVVIFFWRGVSLEVRETLNALGAGVEVAEHLPLLG